MDTLHPDWHDSVFASMEGFPSTRPELSDHRLDSNAVKNGDWPITVATQVVNRRPPTVGSDGLCGR